MRYSSDILIVGAGVGGLNLALRLASKGYRVRMLQQREPLSVRRPEMIQPAGLQAFEELGLFTSLKAGRVAQVERFHFYRIGGGPLCQVDYRVLDHPMPYTLIALPSQIRRVLVRALGAYPGVTVHWDTRVTGIVRKGGQVAGVTAVEGEHEREFSACVTIGADGSTSPLRDALGIGSQVKRYLNGFLGMLVKRPGECADFLGRVHYYLGQGQILGLFPCSPRMLCLLYMVPADGVAAIRQQGIEALKSRIARIEPRIADALGTIASWEHVSRLFPVRVHTTKWVVDGAALIGDAAHACHPHVAQGTFQAMEDGRVLAEVVERCFRKGEFSARMLAPYEETRRSVVGRLQRIADEYVWLWETKHPLLARLRDRIFRNIGSRPVLLHRVAAAEAGIDPSPLTFVERLQALGLCA